MKKTRQLSVFTALTLVMVLLAILTYPSKSIVNTHEDSGKLFFPELKEKLNAIQKFTLRDSNTTYTITKKTDTWVMEEKADFPVKIESVRQLLIALSDLKKHTPKTSVGEHYEVLHLQTLGKEDSRAKQITLYDAGGNILADLLVGKKGPDMRKGEKERTKISSYYVRQNGDTQSWLAKGTLDVSFEPDFWMETKLLDIDKDRVASVHVNHNPPIHINRNDSDQLVLKNLTSSDSAKVNELANLLSFFYFDDVSDSINPGSNPIKARYTLKDSAVLDLFYYNSGDEHWVKFDLDTAHITDTNVTQKYQALSKAVKNRIFKVSSYKTGILNKTLADYKAEKEQ